MRQSIRIALFAFVAVAVLVVIVRQTAEWPAPPVPPTAPITAPQIVAFYFHGTKRCASCSRIESLTRAALQAETDAATVVIRSVNVDEPANAHYVEDFQLAMRTVVLAEEAGGAIRRWQRLDACWDRLGDPADFTAYVQRSLAGFRAAPLPAAP
jgi:hypothetical protein